jgi:hypothetical protein
LILDITTTREVGAPGSTCAFTGQDLWGTVQGNILAACQDGLVLYDRMFHQIAKFEVPLTAYTAKETLLFSPTHEFVAVNPLPRRDVARVLETDTLTQVATFPSRPEYVLALFKEGYAVDKQNNEKEGSELTFHQFHSPHSVLLLKRQKNCPADGFGISESEFLKTSCGKDPGGIVDVTTAQTRLTFPAIDSAHFAQTTTSGKRFALGFQGYSIGHTVKQVTNPITYLAALGTCCDDPSNLFRLRIYYQQSGRMIEEFHWKTNRKEPMWERYDNSGVALSPSGEYVAFLRGTAVEIYRIPPSIEH